MNEPSLDLARTALVLIDLQNSNVQRELAPYSAEQTVGNCVLLAQEMRTRGAMIVYVRVLVGELPAPLADAPMRSPGAAAPAYDASELSAMADVEATDIVVVKRQWGAFYGTELDQLLRRRRIDTLVLGGIATNFGVESTARAAFDRNYRLVFAEDAMSSFDAEAHRFAVSKIFPRMGRVRSTRALIDMLQAGTGDA
ncbi:isochorismatase family protein [Massilia oculi]|uniref:Isochorismatase family protein n=1 Tax=Massilia hydrophila TaxID=3044279 RepID=A0ABS7YEV5_9BURK|nr:MULTISPECIES: isochorismatase family protein [Massilia]MCA1247550.1 isochorismatase family protein [Massilia sp. MS-15]MCA1858235.1 isochorismatase family protein [Massilia oculi]